MKRIANSARFLSTGLALVLASVVAPSPAHADEAGKQGRVIQLRINTPGSDAHPSFHGSVTLKLVGSSTMVEYRWGGSSCPGQKLSDAQVEVLLHAFVQRNRTKLAPTYTMGEGDGTRCLVGFELVAG